MVCSHTHVSQGVVKGILKTFPEKTKRVVHIIGSGVTKGPTDPAVQGGTKSSFECGTIWKNLTKVLAKPRILL